MQNIATLRKESPFYPIFPDGRVPIVNIIVPNVAECQGDGGPQEVYMVDLDKLTEQQFHRVAELVLAQCDPGASLEIAKKEMKARGLPLRAKHVQAVSTDVPFFL